MLGFPTASLAYKVETIMLREALTGADSFLTFAIALVDAFHSWVSSRSYVACSLFIFRAALDWLKPGHLCPEIIIFPIRAVS